MKTLNEIKDEIAFTNGFNDWYDFVEYVEEGHGTAEQYYDEVAKAYALSACEKVREDCKETIDLWRINNEDQIGRDPVGMVDNLTKMIESKEIQLP